MADVYAISEGSYSDYSVRAIFTTRKAAELAISRARAIDSYDDWNKVEVYPLLTEAPESVTTYQLTQDLFDDGAQGKEPFFYVRTTMPWEYDSPPARPEVKFIRAPIHEGKGGRLEVRARTEKACRKAFADRKGQWEARTQGTADKPQWVGGAR